MFQFFSLCYTISSDNVQDKHNEFWEKVYKAYEKSMERIPYNRPHSEWIEAKDFLAENGWADMTYFPKTCKNNPIYTTMLETIYEELDKCQTESGSQFACAMWVMDPDKKEHLLHCNNPDSHLRLFVLLPSEGKEWVLQEHQYNRNYTYKVLFIAMHFPSVFSLSGTWDGASEDGNGRIKKYFRERICNAAEELRRLVFSCAENVQEELSRFYEENWRCINKLYVGLITQRDDFHEEYQLIVKEVASPPLAL